MRRKDLYSMLGRLSKYFVLFLVLVLVLGTVDDSIAQKKKKKKKGKNSEVDLAEAKKKYEFELMKSWSFGYENYKNKEYEGAQKHFWRVAQLDTIGKFSERTYRYLGNSYLNAGDPDSAQVVFELGSQKYPDDAYLHRMIGYLLANRGQLEEAAQQYEHVVSIEPEAVDDLMQLANLYSRLDQDDDAIAAYDKILALAPDNFEAQEKKTALIARTGDIDALIDEEEKIRKANLQNSQVRFDLGKLYFDRSDDGDYQLSIERFQEFLTLVPNDLAAMEFVADAYRRLDQIRNAVQQYQAILAVQPQNKKIIAAISSCYKDMGRFSRARTYAKKAIALDNAYGLGWIAVGQAYEAAAERCVNQKDGKVDFDDKLVYELAAIQYRKALKDLEFRQEAERHLNFLVAVLPTKEDKFMHKNQTKATGECYQWIY